MKYHVEIMAQIEWDAEVEAGSREEAEETAREEFETSQWTNDTTVELINSVTVVELEAPDAGAGGKECAATANT